MSVGEREASIIIKVVKQVGRPRRNSGGHVIQHAEELFRQSVKAGKPDFSYVALAIGSCPGAPPTWAIIECIEHRCDVEMKAARGHTNVSAILDDIIRILDGLQHDFWQRTGGGGAGPQREYSPPSLRSTIIAVVRNYSSWSGHIGSANDDWMKPIREAWDWEQEHDPSPRVEGCLLEGCETTSRIERVIMQSVAAERHEPEDTAKWAWVAKLMIEQQGRDRQ